VIWSEAWSTWERRTPKYQSRAAAIAEAREGRCMEFFGRPEELRFQAARSAAGGKILVESLLRTMRPGRIQRRRYESSRSYQERAGLRGLRPLTSVSLVLARRPLAPEVRQKDSRSDF